TVELGLGERERALVLNRVLRRHDHERLRQLVADAVDGDLPLLHRLEERRLRLRRRAVDLVGQDDLGHDRPGVELEGARGLVVDRDAGDVRGEQVRRELNALEGAARGPREGAGKHRLTDAGYVLDQEVAATEESRSEEHTSELQSRENLVCRPLLEKKKIEGSTKKTTTNDDATLRADLHAMPPELEGDTTPGRTVAVGGPDGSLVLETWRQESRHTR